MKDPLAWFPKPVSGRSFKLSAWAAAVLFILMSWIGRPLVVPGVSPLGIISFEFAGVLDNAQRMLEAWGAGGRLLAAFSLGFDYVFMLAYAAFFALLCLRCASRAPQSLARLGVWLAWGQWLAAAFDALENISLFNVLLGSSVALWPGLAFICAALKFTLIGLAVVYSLASRFLRR